MSEIDLTVDPLDRRIKEVMESISKALRPTEDDQEQKSLVEAIQVHRHMILDIATSAYAARPNDPKLLEALSSLIGQLEKSVRDDRKERAKLQDQQDNKIAFRQVVEALGSFSTGAIQIPTFNFESFNLDPMAEVPNETFKIKDAELTMGHVNLDFDGNKVS